MDEPGAVTLSARGVDVPALPGGEVDALGWTVLIVSMPAAAEHPGFQFQGVTMGGVQILPRGVGHSMSTYAR